MNFNFTKKAQNTFRALQHRNFKLFFIGQCISLIGTWIQQIAISWLIYKLTNSALLMGVITFAGSIPSLFVSPFAGVIIDRINKYHAMIIIQTCFMFEAFAFAVLTLTGVINIWYILILSILLGITNAIDMPLRQSFVIQLVEGNADLSNAISLNSSSFNLARLIGPAIAGVLIAAVGEGVCFLINAISYIAVIGALFMMRIKGKVSNVSENEDIILELKEGYNYIKGFRQILTIIFFLASASLLVMAFQVVMPIYAKEVLHGNAQTLGILMSTTGIGALVGALFLSSRTRIKGLSKIICIASLLFGIGLSGLCFINTTVLSAAFLGIAGFGMVVIIAGCNTLIQYYVDDDKRGRVMGFYTIAFFGTAPFGSLLEGSVADKIGVPYTFLLNGLIMIMLGLILSSQLKYFKNSAQKLKFNKKVCVDTGNI